MNELTPDPDALDPAEAGTDEEVEEVLEHDVDVDVESDADADADADADGDEPDLVTGSESDRVEYDASEWSGESRSLLDSLLTSEGVTHVWQAARLMVGAGDEDAVDALIDIVTATATKGLDPDRAKVVYEVGEWSAAMQTSLAETLEVAEIPFEWDERGDLRIYVEDEERVDEIIDEMPDPDDPETADADGLDVQAVLSTLWESAGVLAKQPNNAEAVLDAIDSAGRMERMSLPFGFESSVWRDIVGKAIRLRAAFESDDDDLQLSDDEIMDGCESLHRQLRHYV